MSTTPFAGLSAKVKAQFKAARASKTVICTDSEVVEADDELTGIPFEIRFAPALAKKPKGDSDKPAEAKSTKDPFEAPYEPDLFVTEDTVKEEGGGDEESFAVLLNKYPINERHFLLVTKEFEKQTNPLSPLQLVATYNILKQLGSREKHLAFFNSGPLSGASQPHKHIQFIPLSNGVAPFDAFINEHKPTHIKDPFQLPLPYANFTAIIAPPAGRDLPSYFASIYLSLLDLMIDHLRRLAVEDEAAYIRLSTLSYNVILTESYIHIVPRTAENYEPKEGSPVSINALGFAGFVLAKDEAALEDLQKVGVMEVLKSVTYPAVRPGELSEEVQDDEEVEGVVSEQPAAEE